MTNMMCSVPDSLLSENMATSREIEKSIIKRFRKKTWSRFIEGIKEFEMVNDGDKIAVAISGGKDSLLMAKMFQELKRHGQKQFELEFISMDPGFNSANRELLEMHCKHMEIPVKIFETNVFAVAESMSSDYPCYLCARMRRGALYSQAQQLGCNKMALGHHYDDVIETIMLNILCAGKYMTMMPKIRAENFENMELIRPMYYLREEDIKKWAVSNQLSPMNCGCVVTAKKTSTKRREIKELISTLGESFKDVEKSIFSSSKNVYKDAILGWKEDDVLHSFLEKY